MGLFEVIDGGMINYADMKSANAEVRLPFSIRLDVVQAKAIQMSGYPARDNQEMARWLYDQGMLCGVEDAPTGDSVRERSRLLALYDTDPVLAQTKINDYVEQRKKDRSIRSNTVLWFASESEWFLFRLRFL
ncbi:MAG: hypothetical protein EOO77_21290 [Oxalobacteraceae bacterium]|nr:MAG: hypothetical protein EOO77_21290 [Oxalobacteraceae bacterium]